MMSTKIYNLFCILFGICLSFCGHSDDMTDLIQQMPSMPQEELMAFQVIPSSGPTTGNIPVVIRSSQFLHIATTQNQAKVFFDGVLADRAFIQTNNSLIVWVPPYKKNTMPGASIPVQIAMEKDDGKIITLSGLFSYEAPVESPLTPVFVSDSVKQVLTENDVGPNPSSIVTADFNEDGILDFALNHFVIGQNGPQDIQIFLGTSRGEFRPSLKIPLTGSGLSHMAVGDINNDGHLDLIVAERYYQNLLLFLGTGDGRFQDRKTQSLVKDVPGDIKLADVDQDGNLDIIIAINSELIDIINNQKIYGLGHTIQVWRGNGTGGLQKDMVTYEVGNEPSNLVVADLNQDGYPDFITSSYTNATLTIELNQGKKRLGVFTKLTTLEVGIKPKALAIADFNEDKIPDLLVNSEGGFFSVYLGKADGYLNYLTTVGGISSYSYSVAIADFDLDGHLDVAVPSSFLNGSSHHISIFHGFGTGLFSLPHSFDSGNNPSMLVTGNIDGDADKKPDLLVVNRGYPSETGPTQSSVRIFLNQSKKK